MDDLITPEVGWLSSNLLKYSHARALAMLGIAVTLNNGMASDDEINDFLLGIADSTDSVYVVNEYYRGLEREHPFLEGFLGPLTRWTEDPVFEDYQRIPEIARLLATIRWSVFTQGEGVQYLPALGIAVPGTLRGAQGDILGQVYNDMTAIGAGRSRVFHYVSIEESMIDLLVSMGPGIARLGNFMDAWCGSGTRAIALDRLWLLLGLPPKPDREWSLNDPQPMPVALAGLNMVAEQIGPRVTLRCDRKWAEVWSARLGSRSQFTLLPPEVRADVLNELP